MVWSVLVRHGTCTCLDGISLAIVSIILQGGKSREGLNVGGVMGGVMCNLVTGVCNHRAEFNLFLSMVRIMVLAHMPSTGQKLALLPCY